MALVRSSFVVAAPVARTFAFIAEPTNFKVMWPTMDDVYDLRPSPRGGTDWRWAYRMLGMRLEGDTSVMEFEPPTRITMRSHGGGLTVDHAWVLAPVDGGTHLELAMDFALPARWLSGVVEPLLTRENRHQVAIAMTNLRRALETGPPVRRTDLPLSRQPTTRPPR